MTESDRPAAGSEEGQAALKASTRWAAARVRAPGCSGRLRAGARQRGAAGPGGLAARAERDRPGLRPARDSRPAGRRVAPGGRVVGVDADPAHTAMAAGFVTDRGLIGVEIVTADARRTGLPSGSFDLVHARTLLVNVPDPAEVTAEMVRLAKPGGQVAVAEPDTEYALCYPPHPAFDRIARSSRRPSPVTAPTRRSAAGYRSCSARPG